MIESLIALLVVILVVALVAGVLIYAIRLLPIPAPFGQIATAVIVVIAALVILMKALPMLNVSV